MYVLITMVIFFFLKQIDRQAEDLMPKKKEQKTQNQLFNFVHPKPSRI